LLDSLLQELNDIRYIDIGNYDIKIAAKDGGK